MIEPLISIVIPNYNYGKFLQQALDSILDQCGEPVDCDVQRLLPIKQTDAFVEVIVCDACSNDNSVDVIRKYSDKISWWCSEKDKGQSDAFNKGFAHAHGRYLTWLNADEVYVKDAFKSIYRFVKRHPESKWITSNDFAFSDKSGLIKYICWGPHAHPQFLKGCHAPYTVFGPSSFIHCDVYAKVGLFDVDIHYGMDVAYWQRMTLAGYRQSRLNRFLWGFRVHEESKTSGTQTEEIRKRRKYEEDIAISRYGRPFDYSWRNVWYALWMLWRFLDGSLLINAFLRCKLVGKRAETILGR